MNQYRIALAAQEDLPACLSTIHLAFAANCEKFGFTRENYPSCAAFLTMDALLADLARGTLLYGAWDAGKIVGCVMLTPQPDGVYAFRRFAVLPQYQHLGLGRQLVHFCTQQVQKSGGEKIELLMVYDNEPLRHFYESCGFALVRTQRDCAHPFLCGIYEMTV